MRGNKIQLALALTMIAGLVACGGGGPMGASPGGGQGANGQIGGPPPVQPPPSPPPPPASVVLFSGGALGTYMGSPIVLDAGILGCAGITGGNGNTIVQSAAGIELGTPDCTGSGHTCQHWGWSPWFKLNFPMNLNPVGYFVQGGLNFELNLSNPVADYASIDVYYGEGNCYRRASVDLSSLATGVYVPVRLNFGDGTFSTCPPNTGGNGIETGFYISVHKAGPMICPGSPGWAGPVVLVNNIVWNGGP